MIRHQKRYLSRAARKTILYIVVTGLAMIILFPIFFLFSFSLMSGYEAYYEWPNPLIPKFSVKFKIDQAKEEAIFRLTKSSMEDLKSEGIPESVLEDLAIFELTKISIGDLRNEDIPDNILEDLGPLEDQKFTRKNEFLNAIEEHIGKEQTAQYKELILKYATNLNPRLKKKFTEQDAFLSIVEEQIGKEQTVRHKDIILKYAAEKYYLSIYNHADKEYQRFGPEKFSLKAEDLEKLSVAFFKRQANCRVSAERLKEEMTKLVEQESVYFSLRKSLLDNYIVFFQITRNSVPAVFRSLYTAFATVVISLIIGGMAGFAFARYRFQGKKLLKLSVLFVRMFPGVAIAIPMVIILGNMGLYDQPIGLSLVYSVTQIALTIWITASIFLGIPIELEEAALIFGTTRFGAFWHITLPLALPGLAACAMYAFIGAWNEAAQAIILTQFNPTFPVVIYEVLVVSGARGQVNLLTAGSIAQALPAVIFTLFIRKYILHMWGGVRV